jgi:putative ATP-binding cassette transporter
MKLIVFLARQSPGSIILAVVAGIISGASNVALLGLFNVALRSEGHTSRNMILSFLALCLFLPLTRFVSETLLTRLAQGALFRLRMQLSSQILSVPLRSLEELGSHRVMGVLTDNIPTIINTLLVLPVLCINIAIVIGGLIYLGWLSKIVLVTVLGFLVVGILSYQLPVIKALHHLNLAREDGITLYKHFRDLFNGAKELKLHRSRRRAFLSDLLKTTAESYKNHNVAGLTIFSAASSWGQILVFLVVGLIILVFPMLKEIDSQTAIGYTITLLYLMSPLQSIMDAAPTLGRANVALKNVDELGLKLAAYKEPDVIEEIDPDHHWQRLEFRNITHAYYRENENESFVLGPIDLTLDRGELVFLTGGNGSGKTTLAKLLSGLYAPESGEVRLDGHLVTDENRESFRQNFSMVFSDFHLFDSLLGLENAALDERAREYLARLQLERKVQIEDGKFSTTDLSQGQRKRLALLTAYMEDRPIYVFDEWAADQDPLFKQIFYYEILLDLKARGKTLIVISHDDKYYGVADRVIKLEYGRIDSDTALLEPSAATVGAEF